MTYVLTRLVPTGLVLTFLLALCWPPVTADAATKQLVALGDSYSSGRDEVVLRRLGLLQTVAVRLPGDRRRPSRGDAVVPGLLGRDHVVGAPEPARHLTSATSYVTISVGGNDAGFSSVLTECAQPWWSSDCNGAIDQAQSIVRNRCPVGSTRCTAPSGPGRPPRRWSSWAIRASSTVRTATL